MIWLMIRRRSLLAASCILVSTAALAEPVRPADDATILLTIPAGQSRAAAELREAKADLTRDGDNLTVALRVARLAIEQGRTWSDPRRYGEAEAALSPWWSAPQPPQEVHVLRAVIRQAQHDFRAALTDLDAVLEESPRNAQARLTRAFVRFVVGDIAGAAEDCRSLPPVVGVLSTATCRAHAAALSGSGQEAYEYLSRSIARSRGTNAAAQRFALVALADIAQGVGRADDAGRLLQTAMALGEPDTPLLTAMADHFLDQGRAADVLDLLDGKGDADVLLLRRAIAAKRTNDPRLGEWSATLNERFTAAKSAGTRLHLREEARFRLEVEADALAALPLAVENWAIQKEIADARLLLECAAAAGKPEATRDVVEFVKRTGLTDQRIMPLVSALEEDAR